MNQQADDILRKLVEDSPIGVTILDRFSSERMFVNSAMTRMLGAASAGKLVDSDVGKSWVNQHDFAQALAIIKRGEVLTNFEAERHRMDGSRCWVLMNAQPVMFEDKDAFIIWHIDITERKTSEERQQRLMTAIDQLEESIVILDENDKVIMSNIAWQKLNSQIADFTLPGTDFEQHLRAGLDKGLFPEAIGREAGWLQVRLARHRNPSGPFVVARQDDTWIQVHEQRLPDGNSIIITSDISELKRSENAHLKSEMQLRAMLENSPIGVAIVSHSRDGGRAIGNRLFVNEALVQMFGAQSADDLLQADISDSWIDREQLLAVEQIMKSGKDLVDFEAKRRRLDGSEWWVSMNSRPISFNGLDCTMNWHFDITDRKRAEEKSNWLSNVIDGLTETVAIYDHDDRLVFCNRTFRERNQALSDFFHLGIKYEDLIREIVSKGVVLDAIGKEESWISERLARHRAGGEPFMVSRSDSNLLINEQRLPDGGVATLAIDLSAQILAEERVKSSEARLEEIFAIAPEAVITIGSDMNIQLFNASAERIFGYRAEEVLGQPMEILMPQHLRQGHERHIGKFRNSPDTYRLMGQRAEISGRRKDGNEFPAAASVSKLDIDGDFIYTVMLQDITQRRKIEEERQKALLDAEMANKAKSAFLATMSHELRTPLNAIIGFSDMMARQFYGALGAPKYKEYAEDILASGTHLLNLVNDILDLSAIEAGEHSVFKEELVLSEVIADVSPMLAQQVQRKDILYTVERPEYLPVIFADRRSVKQILLNLLTNAIKFTPTGGKVILRLDVTDSHHILEVIDTGKGIRADEIVTLTRPFARGDIDSHRAQEGTGLGLSIVKSLIDLHQGELGIQSEVGRGTTVTVKLASDGC